MEVKSEYVLVNNIFRVEGSKSTSDFDVAIDSAIFYNQDSSHNFELACCEVKMTNSFNNIYNNNDKLLFLVRDTGDTNPDNWDVEFIDFKDYHKEYLTLTDFIYQIDLQLNTQSTFAYNASAVGDYLEIEILTGGKEIAFVDTTFWESNLSAYPALQAQVNLFKNYFFQSKQLRNMLGITNQLILITAQNFLTAILPWFTDSSDPAYLQYMSFIDLQYPLKGIYIQCDVISAPQVVSSKSSFYVKQLLQSVPNNSLVSTDETLITFDPHTLKFLKSQSPYYRRVRFWITDIYNFILENAGEVEFVLVVRASKK